MLIRRATLDDMSRRLAVVLVSMAALAACGSPEPQPSPQPSPLPDVNLPVAASSAPVKDARVDARWLRETAAATRIPTRALRAYAIAEATIGSDDPDCGLSWNTLAGIGRTESVHGAVNGSRVGDDGVARPDIRGIPLDGDGVRRITDTDRGELDGDRRWDRAVGPMQFIPTTWARWGADGDRDGRNNPQDIDDASLAAAAYLCDAGKSLDSGDGWVRAVITYNNSAEYARTISRTATRYAESR